MLGKRKQDGCEAERGRASEAEPPCEHPPDPPPTHHHAMPASLRPVAACVRLPRVVQGWSLLPHPALSSLPPTTSELLSLLSTRSLCCWHEAGEGGCLVGPAPSCASVAALSLLSLARLSPHLTRHFRMACPAYSLSLFLAFSLLSFAVATAYSRTPASLAHALAPLCLDTHTPPTLAPAFLLLALPTSDSLWRECVDCGGRMACRLFSRRYLVPSSSSTQSPPDRRQGS